MHRTRRDQPVVEWRATDAAGGGVLPVGPVHGVEQAQRLGRAVAQVGAIALERVQAADVDVGEVDGHAAVADPFGEDLAGAARALDADRVEAAGDEQVAHLGRLAEQVAVVRGEALRAVEEGLDTGGGQDRQAPRGALQDRLEMIHVLGQAVEAEGLRDAAHPPGLGHRLEGADQQLAGVLLVVGAFVGHPQHRQLARHLGQRAR